jgi:hypothetical protein
MKPGIKLPTYTVPSRREKSYKPTQYTSNIRQLSIIPTIAILGLVITTGLITLLITGVIPLPTNLQAFLTTNKTGVASFVQSKSISLQKKDGDNCKLNPIEKPNNKVSFKPFENISSQSWFEFDSTCKNKSQITLRAVQSATAPPNDLNSSTQQSLVKNSMYFTVYFYGSTFGDSEKYNLSLYFPSIFKTANLLTPFFNQSEVNSTLLIENNQYYLQNNCFSDALDGCEVYRLDKTTNQTDLIYFDPTATKVKMSQKKDTQSLILLKTESENTFSLVLINLENINSINRLPMVKEDASYSKYF